jgi:hypothetical protein
MGRAFRGCCCGVAFLLVIAAALIGWNGFHTILPGIGNAAATQSYTDAYNTAISDYTKRLEEIKSDPKLRSAQSAAQKHIEHIHEMKQIVDAQNVCEHALKSIKPPQDLRKFNSAMQVYFQELSKKSREREASVKHQDVPDLNVNLRKIDESAHDAAVNVDRTLAQIPHYEQGKKELLDLWSTLKQKMNEAAPPENN